MAWDPILYLKTNQESHMHVPKRENLILAVQPQTQTFSQYLNCANGTICAIQSWNHQNNNSQPIAAFWLLLYPEHVLLHLFPTWFLACCNLFSCSCCSYKISSVSVNSCTSRNIICCPIFCRTTMWSGRWVLHVFQTQYPRGDALDISMFQSS